MRISVKVNSEFGNTPRSVICEQCVRGFHPLVQLYLKVNYRRKRANDLHRAQRGYGTSSVITHKLHQIRDLPHKIAGACVDHRQENIQTFEVVVHPPQLCKFRSQLTPRSLKSSPLHATALDSRYAHSHGNAKSCRKRSDPFSARAAFLALLEQIIARGLEAPASIGLDPFANRVHNHTGQAPPTVQY